MNTSFSSLRSRPTVAVPGIYLRSSTAPVHSSVSSLNSLFTSSTLPPGTEDNFRSLIHQAFVPHIGVHASEDTDILARDKGFASFKDLIRPYGESVTGRVTVRDSQGLSLTHEDFGIRIRGLAELAAIAPDETRRNSRVNGNAVPFSPGDIKSFTGGNIQHVEELVKLHIDHAEDLGEASGNEVPPGQSFYLLYLQRMLSGMPMSPHETFTHPVACIIAISSRNTAPIETLRNLYASGSSAESGMPSYVNNDYIRYYVLVHDEDKDDIMKSNALFDQMKKHFGLHCHLLRLRSAPTVITDDDSVPVPPCQWLSAAEELVDIRSKDRDEYEGTPTRCLPETDASGIRTMVREMVAQSVIPYMERCITTWNDQVASRRRGLSGRFLSMSKRYFGSSSRNSTGGGSSTSNYDPTTASYSPVSPEAQMRKLADYAFMLRDWKLAYSVYDLLRTDFSNDKAWKYHAGAQEMTALSLLLTGSPLTTKLRADTIDPMLDLACYSYISRCTSTYAALRCLLVAVELLRLRGGGCADDAARWAVRALEMISLGTVGHALVTERVGACFEVRKGVGNGGWGARSRKAAMWNILAAREYVDMGKASQARHCLERALPVYKDTRFSEVSSVLGTLRAATQFAPGGPLLVDDDDEGLVMSPQSYGGGGGAANSSSTGKGEVESERLHLGHNRRKSAVVELAGLSLGSTPGDHSGGGGAKAEDDFVDS